MAFSDFSPFKRSGSNIVPKFASSRLQFGNLTSDPAGLTPSDEGLLWYRSDLNEYRYWDGSSAQSFGSGNPFSYLEIANNTPIPQADGENAFYYQFNTGAELTDGGDWGPFNLDNSEVGTITQNASTLAPYYDLQLTGATAPSDRLFYDSGSLPDETYLSGTGFTFYINFTSPATMNDGEIMPLFLRSQTGAGPSGSGLLMGAFIFQNGGNMYIQAATSNAAGTSIRSVSASSLSASTNYQLVVKLDMDGETISGTLNGVAMSIGGSGTGSTFTGWLDTDVISFLGGTEVDFSVLSLTQVAYSDICIDQVLFRTRIDTPAYVFDASFTGSATLQNLYIDGSYGTINVPMTIMGIDYPSVPGTLGQFMIMGGSNNLQFRDPEGLNEAYSWERYITPDTFRPVQIVDGVRDGEYRGIKANLFVSNDGYGIINYGEGGTAFKVMNTTILRLKTDDDVTFPAPDQIDFGVDLAALGLIAPGTTTDSLVAGIVVLRGCDVTADDGMYIVTALSNGTTTNSVATVISSIDGLSPNFTSTTAKGSCGNATSLFGAAIGNVGACDLFGGPHNQAGTGYVQKIQLDGGSYAEGQLIANSSTGTLTNSLQRIVQSNASLTVPATKYENYGGADIRFSQRSSDPSVVSEGDIWYNDTDKVLRYSNGTTTIDITGGGGGGSQYTSVTSNSYTLDPANDTVIGVNFAGTVTFNLPAASSITTEIGKVFYIKDESGASFANPINITPNGTDLIDGSNSVWNLQINYGSIGIYTNGTSWFII